jgi:ankyrin repeat protein
MSDLITAIRRGEVNIVQRLIEEGADIHAFNDYALIIASIQGNVLIVELLI